MQERLRQAAEWIHDATGLLITAGAGMGVDSGLPDFRGPEGFWKAYPGLKAHGLTFTDIANPQAFHGDARLAWGFYGHRLALYRNTVPHEGFDILRRWADAHAHGSYVFTSNVDGQFQTAGFSETRVAECHGAIRRMQCLGNCAGRVWSADGFEPDVDEETSRLRNALPRCPTCGGLARPNILMFDDVEWLGHRYEAAVNRAHEWVQSVERLVIIEIGAGRAIPPVRRFGERSGGRLIRIGPDDWKVSRRSAVGLQGGGLAVLRQLDELLAEWR